MTLSLKQASGALIGGLILVLAAPAPALAGGGSGGGSQAAPSRSAPTVDPVAAYREGVQLYQTGEYREAERTLKSAARVARKDPATHYMLGLSQMAQEKWRPAARTLAKAVKLNPDHYEARAQLGLAHLKRGNTSKAEDQMTQLEASLAACASDCPQTLTDAADLLRAAITPDAETDVSAALGKVRVPHAVKSGDLAYFDAVRLINLERYDAAKAALTKANAVFGPHPDILTYLGFTHRKAGAYETAISFYEAALEIDPNHLSANEYLGEYYVELGDLSRAKAQLAKLETLCAFGCAQVDELSRWIDQAES